MLRRLPLQPEVPAMKKSEIEHFKNLLEQKRASVIQRAQDTIAHDMALDQNEMPDEMDLASTEYMQSFTFRLRGRERFFLQKIDKALKKIEDDEFGICEECEEPIGLKRLEARPETELCIRCKEDEERTERDFA
ncbi:MAG: TraR/DksA C4-type zinc finger protein [Polyangiales bacterium]